MNYDNQRDEIEEIQALNKLEILLANVNTMSCKEKIDEIVNTNDLIHIIVYRSLNKSPIRKLGITDELDDLYIIACYFLKELVLSKVIGQNQFSLISAFRTNPQKKASSIFLTP